MYSLLLALAAVIVATKLLGELARRLGQPSVLGELLAGVILGGSALAVIDPRDPAVHALGQLGLFVLIFQIGLHTDVRALRRVGSTAMAVAAAGVVLPFAGGYLAARALGVPALASVIAGASLTATSMAISARVLGDHGVLHTREGQVVLGAALADDVIGLIILSVVVAAVGGASITAIAIGRTTVVSAGFIALSLAVGAYAVPPLFRVLDGIRAKGSLGMFGLAFGMLLAALALASGASAIIGAFVAGLILHPTAQRQEVERTTAQIGHFLVPVFFAVAGASVELTSLASGTALAAGASLAAVAVAGKLVAGFVPWRFNGNKLLVGAAMVPRGEVGLIFAQMGLATGAITPGMFGAIMFMVVVTTFVTPPMLAFVIRRDESLDREDAPAPQMVGPEGRRQTRVGRRH